jgi:4-hydroxy-tetrahydrodipicolinate synthase
MMKGSLVAIVTPMHADGALDFVRLKQLIAWHKREGTVAVVVVGTTGESPTLEFGEHMTLVAKAVEFAEGMPIVAGIGANSTKEAVHLAKGAKEAGAVAGLAVVPYYNKPTQDGMYAHFATVAERTEFPQIVYNIPGRTACDMRNETILRLTEIPSVIGLKDATSSMARAMDLIYAARKDFALYAGDDETALPYMLLGGHGVISVTANIAPRLMSQLCEAALAGRALEARTINERIQPIHAALTVETNPIPVKFAMAEMGLIETGIRPPMTFLNDKFHSVVRNAISGLVAEGAVA